jgi:hypothetical protein
MKKNKCTSARKPTRKDKINFQVFYPHFFLHKAVLNEKHKGTMTKLHLKLNLMHECYASTLACLVDMLKQISLTIHFHENIRFESD